jgi:hypothetical protein
MARQRIELAAEEAEELSRRARATTVPVRDRQRAEIILLSVQGLNVGPGPTDAGEQAQQQRRPERVGKQRKPEVRQRRQASAEHRDAADRHAIGQGDEHRDHHHVSREENADQPARLGFRKVPTDDVIGSSADRAKAPICASICAATITFVYPRMPGASAMAMPGASAMAMPAPARQPAAPSTAPARPAHSG